jgi:hypothetical protein
MKNGYRSKVEQDKRHFPQVQPVVTHIQPFQGCQMAYLIQI